MYCILLHSDPLTDWGVNISRNITHYILPDNDTTLIEPRNICEQKLFLLIIVCSGLQNFVARFLSTICHNLKIKKE